MTFFSLQKKMFEVKQEIKKKESDESIAIKFQ